MLSKKIYVGFGYMTLKCSPAEIVGLKERDWLGLISGYSAQKSISFA